jgi:hypothetical protein
MYSKPESALVSSIGFFNGLGIAGLIWAIDGGKIIELHREDADQRKWLQPRSVGWEYHA